VIDFELSRPNHLPILPIVDVETFARAVLFHDDFAPVRVILDDVFLAVRNEWMRGDRIIAVGLLRSPFDLGFTVD
jgi:hypothetical protein